MKNKIKKIKLLITPEVREKFPDLQEVMAPVFNVNVKKDDSILNNSDFENLLGNKNEDEFFNEHEFELFREFAKDLKIDLRKNPPSVEFLYKQFKKTGRVPHINNVVDAANKVALETLVATGTFDMDKITGDMRMRFTREGEEFRPLGGDLEFLPAGLVVIADEEKILNLFPFRDSVFQKITDETKNVLILADKMPGQDMGKVKDAVAKVADLLVTYTKGTKGEMYLAEEEDSKLTVSVSFDDLKNDTTAYKGVKRVFSGTRATGRLHLGNYLGAVKGYLALQEMSEFECIFMAVDVHTITTPYESKNLPAASRNIIMDYLACGLDPEKAVVTLQSMVPEHMELAFLFSSVITVARMQHLPTFKEKVKQHPDNVTMALLNYPVLMAADILIYKAGLVPVGIDQEPHLEVAREIARKMNDTYGTDFPEPVRFATRGEYVPSLTGEGKMSKSVEGSYINLSDTQEVIREKLAKVPTDSGKGDFIPPVGGVANLLTFVELFEGDERRKEYEKMYVGSGIKYKDLKEELAEAIYKELEPIQERRKIYENDPSLVERILKDGAAKARITAAETIKEVKNKMGLFGGVV